MAKTKTGCEGKIKKIGRRLSRSLGAHAGLDGSSSASIVYSMQPWCREPRKRPWKARARRHICKNWDIFTTRVGVATRKNKNKTQHLASAASHNALPLPSTRSVLGIGSIPAHPRHQTSSPCSTCAAWTKPSARQDFLFIFYCVETKFKVSAFGRFFGFSVSVRVLRLEGRFSRDLALAWLAIMTVLQSATMSLRASSELGNRKIARLRHGNLKFSTCLLALQTKAKCHRHRHSASLFPGSSGTSTGSGSMAGKAKPTASLAAATSPL